MDALAFRSDQATRATGRPRPAPPGPAGRPAAEQSRRSDIQGLRAVAVILVIANHAGMPGFRGGYVGVDVFFVISGYVITRLLLRETSKGVRAGLTDFYCRRIRRIVPAATATLVATTVVAGLLLGPLAGTRLPGDVRWASLFAADFRLITTGSNYFVPGLRPSLITHFWSLAVEEQFYLLFPLAVFMVARLARPRHRRLALTVTLSVAVAGSAWWSFLTSATDPVSAYYSPLTRFWELGLGCLLAVVVAHRGRQRAVLSGTAAALGAALVLAAVMELNASSVYPGWRAWLPCAGTALILWAGGGESRPAVTRVLSVRPLRYLGDLSYSLYLVHFAWLNLPLQLAHPLTGPLWRVAEIAGLLVTAMCSYHLLENPIRRSRRLAADRGATLLALAVCLATSWTVTLLVTRLTSR